MNKEEKQTILDKLETMTTDHILGELVKYGGMRELCNSFNESLVYNEIIDLCKDEILKRSIK